MEDRKGKKGGRGCGRGLVQESKRLKKAQFKSKDQRPLSYSTRERLTYEASSSITPFIKTENDLEIECTTTSSISDQCWPSEVPSACEIMEIDVSPDWLTRTWSGHSGSPLSVVEPVEEGWRVDAGSDPDEEDDQPNDLGIDYPLVRPPTLASDSPAELRGNINPSIITAIEQMDSINDRVISNLLPADSLVFSWRSDVNQFHGLREEFTATPGPTFPLSEMESPVHAFLKFWDQDFISSIVQETNNYAAQCLKGDLTTHSRLKRWHPTTVNELYVFFAVLLHQSLNPHIVEYECYYPSSRMTAMPYFKEYISYNRLILLKKFLHFTDNSKIPSTLSPVERRLHKIQPIVSHLNRKFQSLYLPGQNIVIDESLLKRQGHLTFIQKMAMKVAKTGIKAFELCESETGYLWKFAIFAGKDATDRSGEIRRDEADDGTGETGDRTDETGDRSDETGDRTDESGDRTDDTDYPATAKIVYDLASSLFHMGYTIIMDNFYNSPLLARCLKMKGMDCYGTLRLSRENVPSSLKSLSEEQLSTGDVVSFTSGDLNVLVWKDFNLVSMISTYHNAEVGVSEKSVRWQYKPQVVVDYNKSSGGVDKKEQLLSNFPMERKKSSAWCNKFFRRLLNVSVQNAFIIYRCKDKTITHRRFRQLVAESLLKNFFHLRVPLQISNVIRTTLQLPGGGRNPPRPVLERNHFNVKFDREPLFRQCVWCSLSKKRSRTSRKCDVCEVALCHDCMKPYHTGVQPP